MWVWFIIAGVASLIGLFLLNFYRDPERTIPKGNNIVSPADGKVISIIDTSKSTVKIRKGLIGKIRTMTKDIAKECYVVSIFMSPLDVHINRSPIEGTVRSIKHTKGKFFKAYDLEKSLENEKNEIIIQNKKLKIKAIQIAGFLARRILCYTKAGKKVNKGQRIGMIALGSQATIIMPKSVKLKIKMKERVKAGSTIIAQA
jgi:phosphatidylserine decarboxylase